MIDAKKLITIMILFGSVGMLAACTSKAQPEDTSTSESQIGSEDAVMEQGKSMTEEDTKAGEDAMMEDDKMIESDAMETDESHAEDAMQDDQMEK